MGRLLGLVLYRGGTQGGSVEDKNRRVIGWVNIGLGIAMMAIPLIGHQKIHYDSLLFAGAIIVMGIEMLRGRGPLRNRSIWDWIILSCAVAATLVAFSLTMSPAHWRLSPHAVDGDRHKYRQSYLQDHKRMPTAIGGLYHRYLYHFCEWQKRP